MAKIQKHKNTDTQIQRQIRMMVVLETSVYLSIRNILHNCAKYIQIQIQKFAYVDPQRGDINSDDGGSRNFRLSVN